MVVIEFENIRFFDGDTDVKSQFYKIFSFNIPKVDLDRIGKFKVEDGKLIFEGDNERRIMRRFRGILDRYFPNLVNNITKKPAIYVHENGGIPLIGTNYFGIVDRGTNIIELKPMNGCNLDCVYCSVDENKRQKDFVVEEEYLFSEFKKLVEFKGVDKIEAHIAGQCEPLLYAPLNKLIKDISGLKNVSTISIDTNGQLLTKEKVDELIAAGITRINLSLNSLDQKMARDLAGNVYDVDKIKELVPYIADRIDLIVAPVMMSGLNEDDCEEIVKWIKSLEVKNRIRLGIQNYLRYKFGKKPVKEVPFDKFFEKLHAWEKKYDMNLTKIDIPFFKAKAMEKPFKKDDVVEASVKCDGRFLEEKIAVCGERSIVVPDCKKKGRLTIKITRDKDNIYFGDNK